MCPPTSSLKWGDDGELSPNDTLNLVEKLTRAEQESRQGVGRLSTPVPYRKIQTPLIFLEFIHSQKGHQQVFPAPGLPSVLS